MHIKTKTQLLNILSKIQKLHQQLHTTTDESVLFSVFESCQQAAITVGETIEKNIVEDRTLIPLLEGYCEAVFLCTQDVGITNEAIANLTDIINDVILRIEALPSTYRVVFFPYKVEMWDSLESIWRACAADKNCECDVVPIPYFHFNSEKKQWEPQYDGNKFPKDVPVTPYEYYNLAEMQPDIAYVHNPYDDHNFVTSVHPAYYSKELKKYVSKLVYVPYYVTPGWIERNHLQLSVHLRMDYMIAQSDYAKECCSGLFYYDKVLPLGSPKLDRVIRKCKEGVQMPEEWRPVLAGKKVLLLNTSIGDLLNYGEYLFKKIEWLFEIVKGHDNVALLWRPHPLFESTIKSMRPELMERYQSVVKEFWDKQIGVFDRTSDVTDSVALVDGYVDFGGSSVINLVGIAGKPIMLLDISVNEPFAEAEKRRVHFYSMYANGDDIWFGSTQYNALFRMNREDRKLHLVERVEGEAKWDCVYPWVAGSEEGLYLSSYIASKPMLYDFESKKSIPLCYDELKDYYFWKNIAYNNHIYYLSVDEFLLMELDTVQSRWKCHTDCMVDLWNGLQRENYMRLAYDGVTWNDSLWVTTGFSNRILQLSVEDGTHKIHTLGAQERKYSGITATEDALWLADSETGELVKWIPDSETLDSVITDGEILDSVIPNGGIANSAIPNGGITNGAITNGGITNGGITNGGITDGAISHSEISECYPMPQDLNIWNIHTGYRQAHSRLIVAGDYIITVPLSSAAMVRLNYRTGEADILAGDFWKPSEMSQNGYMYRYAAVCDCADALDDRYILAQRNCDNAMAIIDVENNTWEEFYPEMSEADFEELTAGEDGFEKADRKVPFWRRESKLFTLEGFVEDLANGQLNKPELKERQLKALSFMAANLDGTCGEKVHEYMMNVLKQ